MNIYFTSDTHFDSERTLMLSKRPFSSVLDMNNSIIENWNKLVTSNDIVYHLGDIGNYEYLNYLNGKIRLVMGNYDTMEVCHEKYGNKIDYILPSGSTERIYKEYFKLVHNPFDKKYKSVVDDSFYLFGHIHKCAMVKRNGLNVGVDCHNFKPIHIDEVLFWKNAILNHYDENVFCDRVN